jgi:hypothetical protein
MISSLDDAWKWYEGVHTLARDMNRLGEKFWDRSEWEGPLGLDNRFRSVTSDDLRGRASTILNDLDDLAVLLMFSVFEEIVRHRAEIDVEHSLPRQLHPAVAVAVK